MADIIYYHDRIRLAEVFPINNAAFAALGGVRSKHNYYDGFKRLAGRGQGETGAPAVYPVTRAIIYKSNPSLHKCDGRCLHAKGQNCECSCGGANHGAGA